jgi:hypothetical protein
MEVRLAAADEVRLQLPGGLQVVVIWDAAAGPDAAAGESAFGDFELDSLGWWGSLASNVVAIIFFCAGVAIIVALESRFKCVGAKKIHAILDDQHQVMDRMHEIMDLFHHAEGAPEKDPLSSPVAALLFEKILAKLGVSASQSMPLMHLVNCLGSDSKGTVENLVKSGLLPADMVGKAKEIDVRNQELQANKEGQEMLRATKRAVASGAQEASGGAFTGLGEGIEVVVDPRRPNSVVPLELQLSPLSGSARGSSELTASKATMLSAFAADLSNAEAAYMASLLRAPGSTSFMKPPKVPKAPRSSRKAKKKKHDDKSMMDFSNPITSDSPSPRVRTPSTGDGNDSPLFDDTDRNHR